MKRVLSSIVVLILIASSCSKIFMPYELFLHDRNITYTDPAQLLEKRAVLLRSGDVISVSVHPNKGLDIISPFQQSSTNKTESFTVTVEQDGYIDLPVVGKVSVAGKTLDVVRQELTQLYSGTISEPYVRVALSQFTVTVFTGGRNSGKSITLQVPEATLIEVIAMAGGVNTGRANEVYLIRNQGNQINIYKLDLSKAQNVIYAHAPVYSGDIILVRSQSNAYRLLIENVLPYMNIVTTILLVMNLLK